MERSKKALGIVALAAVLTLVAAACGGNNNTGGTSGTPSTGTSSGGGSIQNGGVYRTAIEDFGFTGAFDPTGGERGLTRLGHFLQQLKIALDLLLRRVRGFLRFQFLIQPCKEQPLHQRRRR